MSGPPRPRAAVVGAMNLDLVVRCVRLPEPGETIMGSDVVRGPGGKGNNQAAALATLGLATSMVACVGDDDAGRWMTGCLEDLGVDVGHVQHSARPTGTAFITVDDQGENEIVVSSGANQDLDLATVDLESFDVVVAQMELSAAIVDEVAHRARRLVLNVAPAREVAPATLRACAVVIANELESRLLDLTSLARCVVTRGARGAAHLAYGEVVAEVSPPRVDVVDTVGAGDAFCAAYAARVALGDTPDNALAYAVTAGSLATRALGAQGSLPTHEEVLTWLPRAS